MKVSLLLVLSERCNDYTLIIACGQKTINNYLDVIATSEYLIPVRQINLSNSCDFPDKEVSILLKKYRVFFLADCDSRKRVSFSVFEPREHTSTKVKIVEELSKVDPEL